MLCAGEGFFIGFPLVVSIGTLIKGVVLGGFSCVVYYCACLSDFWVDFVFCQGPKQVCVLGPGWLMRLTVNLPRLLL